MVSCHNEDKAGLYRLTGYTIPFPETKGNYYHYNTLFLSSICAIIDTKFVIKKKTSCISEQNVTKYVIPL